MPGKTTRSKGQPKASAKTGGHWVKSTGVASKSAADCPDKRLWESINWNIQNGVLVAEFPSPGELAVALRGVHDAYEGGRLVGPLCGVNIPLSFVEKHYTQAFPVSSSRQTETEAETDADTKTDTDTEGGGQHAGLASESGEHAVLRNVLEAVKGGKVPPVTYLCAHVRNDLSTRLHEYAHAVYHSDETYRTLAGTLWDGLSATARLYYEKELRLRNYSPDNWPDEWQAYTVEGAAELGKKYKEENTRPHELLRKALGRLDWQRLNMPSFRCLEEPHADAQPSGRSGGMDDSISDSL